MVCYCCCPLTAVVQNRGRQSSWLGAFLVGGRVFFLRLPTGIGRAGRLTNERDDRARFVCVPCVADFDLCVGRAPVWVTQEPSRPVHPRMYRITIV